MSGYDIPSVDLTREKINLSSPAAAKARESLESFVSDLQGRFGDDLLAPVTDGFVSSALARGSIPSEFSNSILDINRIDQKMAKERKLQQEAARKAFWSASESERYKSFSRYGVVLKDVMDRYKYLHSPCVGAAQSYAACAKLLTDRNLWSDSLCASDRSSLKACFTTLDIYANDRRKCRADFRAFRDELFLWDFDPRSEEEKRASSRIAFNRFASCMERVMGKRKAIITDRPIPGFNQAAPITPKPQ